MLLRYIEKAFLKKATKTKQSNGTYIETLEDVGKFHIQTQEMTDEVSASVYGASIFKMVRVRSINQRLEKLLYSKVNNKNDNISLYYIIIKDRKYAIRSVNASGVDLELVQ